MRVKRVVAAILLLLSVVPFVSPVFSQVEHIQGFGSPVEGVVAPGETGVPVNFTFVNEGPFPLLNVNFTFTNTYPFYLDNYHNGSPNFFVTYWAPGRELSFVVFLNVSESAKLGTYNYGVKLSYYENASGVLYSVSQTLDVPVPVMGSVQLSLNSLWGSVNQPLAVGPGETNVPLTVLVKNTGTVTASNVTVYFKSREYPLIFQQTNLTIGYVPAGEENLGTVMASVYPNVSGTGVYYVPVTVHYFQQNLTELLPVYIEGSVTLSVDSLWGSVNQPLAVGPGETNVPLTVLVKNTGTVTASNVTVYFKSREYPLIFQQTNLTIGYVPAGEENLGTVMASVYPNVSGTGVYYVPVTVHYFQQNLTELLPISIYLPNITALLYTVPPEVFPGYYQIPITAVLINYGSALAENLTVHMSSPFPIVSQNPIKLGALPSGGRANISFIFNVPNDTLSKVYYFNLTVSYDGGKYIQIYPLTIQPKANILVTKVYQPTLNPGSSQVGITITLLNDGNATAKNVRVILNPSDVVYPYVSSSNPLSALTASSTGIGDLAPGQAINVTFVIDVAGGISAGHYAQSVTLVWNQTGSFVPFVQADQFQINVSPPFTQVLLSELSSIYVIAIIIVVVVLAVLVVLLRARRK